MIEERIQELKYELQTKKEEISQIAEQLNNETDAALMHKLSQLNAEYNELLMQIQAIHSNLKICKSLQSKADYNPQPTTIKEVKPIPQKAKTQTQPKQSPKVKKDIEKTLGKNVMGIVASILVFVSLILFSIVMLPRLTETIKIIGMYVISSAITGLGIYLVRKDNTSPFNLSIAGCGMGAIFLSLMTQKLYFHSLSNIALLFILLAWTFGVSIFSGMQGKHKTFIAICETGISIATLAGMFELSDNTNYAIVTLILFTLIAEVIIYIFNNKADVTQDSIMHIFHASRLFILSMYYVILNSFGDYSITQELIHIALFGAFFGVGLYAYYASNKPDKMPLQEIILSIYAISLTCITISISNTICTYADDMSIISCTLVVLILTCFMVYCRDRIIPNIISIITSFAFVTSSFNSSVADFFLIPILIFIPMVILAQNTQNTIFKWGALTSSVINYIFLCNIRSELESSIFLGFILSMLIVVTLFYLYNQKENAAFISCTYLSAMIFSPILLLRTLENTNNPFLASLSPGFVYAAITIAFLLISKQYLIGTEKIDTILNNIIMFFLICRGIEIINDSAYIPSRATIDMMTKQGTTISLWITGITLIALNTFKTVDLLSKGKGYGIAISISYLLSLITIIDNLTDLSYVTSISVLLLSIMLIFLGFKIKIGDNIGNKEMRLFGLVVSMVDIVKLLMIDIKHNDLLEASGYLLLAGILCFVISFIYNKLDKSTK